MICLTLEMCRRSLETMSFAYSSKNIAYPIPKLKQALLFNSWEETITECRFYGIEVTSENNVQFSKRILDSEVRNKIMNHDLINDIFTYLYISFNLQASPRRLKPLDTKLSKVSLSKLIFVRSAS